MLKPPYFTKKSQQNTFTAELSTTVNMTKEFFLPSGVNHCNLQTRNDSFSFNKKNQDIFNPVENFSCIKKETPKFGRVENQISTPSKNMIEKLTKIKNQIRLEKTLNQVLHLKKEASNGKSQNNLFPGEKAREFQNQISKRRKLASSVKKIDNQFTNENDNQSSNSSFLSKGKRVLSYKVKRSKKGPKILGKKHLEIFHSKFMQKVDKAPQKFNCFISNRNKRKNKKENQKYQKRTKSKQTRKSFKKNPTLNTQNPTPNPLWAELFPMLSGHKLLPKNPQIKAKHLSKNFQNQFRKGILNSFRNIPNNSSFTSASKENTSSIKKSKFDEQQRNLEPSSNRNRKLNLRYQSARKCTYSTKKCEHLGLTQRNPNSGKMENQFLMRELRFMIDKNKGRSASKKKPIIPTIDFRL